MDPVQLRWSTANFFGEGVKSRGEIGMALPKSKSSGIGLWISSRSLFSPAVWIGIFQVGSRYRFPRAEAQTDIRKCRTKDLGAWRSAYAPPARRASAPTGRTTGSISSPEARPHSRFSSAGRQLTQSASFRARRRSGPTAGPPKLARTAAGRRSATTACRANSRLLPIRTAAAGSGR